MSVVPAVRAMLLADPCSYCGQPAAAVDHVIPRVAGGSDDWTNLTAACRSCNSSKSGMTLLGYLLRGRWRPVMDDLDLDERQTLMDGLHELGLGGYPPRYVCIPDGRTPRSLAR